MDAHKGFLLDRFDGQGFRGHARGLLRVEEPSHPAGQAGTGAQVGAAIGAAGGPVGIVVGGVVGGVAGGLVGGIAGGLVSSRVAGVQADWFNDSIKATPRRVAQREVG